MADPTASDTLPEARGPNIRLNAPVQDTLQTYAGQFAVLNTHDVAAAGGTMAPHTGASGESLIGVFSDEVLGDAVKDNNVDGGGKILKRVAVTGVVSAVADAGKAVYLADSGGPFVLTPIAAEAPSGVIVRVNGAADCDVWLFGMEARWVMELLAGSLYAGTTPTISLASFQGRIGNV